MSAFPAFPFFYVKHHTVFDFVEQATSFWIREDDFDSWILSPQVCGGSGQCPART